jgi:dihydrodipicolinate synthase/N-acetylneuraminate lyase
LDQTVNARYAEYVAGTWVEHVVVAGPVGAGEFCTAGQRATVVDLWARHHPPEHLIVACWERHEVDRALDKGMRALVMMRCETDGELLDTLAELPAKVIAYTNPRYSRAVLDPAAIGAARSRGVLPSAVKLSKVSLAELAQVRAVGGTDLRIIHGSSRDIADSLAAGVNIVVSSPLAALPRPWPTPTLDAVQRAANQLQRMLDAQTNHGGRVGLIAELAGMAIASTGNATSTADRA